jgi:hypothetical protein
VKNENVRSKLLLERKMANAVWLIRCLSMIVIMF